MAASLVLSACAFEPGTLAEDDGTGEGEDPSGTGTGSDTGSGAPLVQPCTFPDADLRLCLDFDDAKLRPIVTDASVAKLDGTATELEPASRSGKPAAGFGWSSRIDVPESPTLDIAGALTLEMWVWPEYPHSAILLDNNGQYRIQLAVDGRLGCVLGNTPVWSDDSEDAREWTHVACVYSANTLTIFINGSSAGTTVSVGAPGTGTSGTRLGYFAGRLDDIHVYARALTAAQVCTHAGRTTCSSGPGGQFEGDDN